MDCAMLLLKAVTVLSTRKTGIWDTVLDEFQQFRIYCILPHVALCLMLGCYELVGFLTSRGFISQHKRQETTCAQNLFWNRNKLDFEKYKETCLGEYGKRWDQCDMGNLGKLLRGGGGRTLKIKTSKEGICETERQRDRWGGGEKEGGRRIQLRINWRTYWGGSVGVWLTSRSPEAF